MSTHPVNCLHDTLEAVPQTRDIDNAERLAEIPLHWMIILAHASNSVKVSDIFVLKLISVSVFILLSSQNFYFI